MKTIFKSVIFLALCITLIGCSIEDKFIKSINLKFISTDLKINKLKELAYNPKTNEIGEVYVLENNTYIPYLVITDNYYGDCLLLRKNVRNENIPAFGKDFKNTDEMYYGNSFLDYYLNHRFIKDLSPYIAKNIKAKDIDVIKDDSISSINRKIFLLSKAEVSQENDFFKNKLKDGKPIAFFNNKKLSKITRQAMRETSDEEGLSANWTLRTIDEKEELPIGVILANFDGKDARKPYGKVKEDGIKSYGGSYRDMQFIGYQFLEVENNIRPAFALSGDTPIIKTKLSNGNTVFALEEQKEEPDYKKDYKIIGEMITNSTENINSINIEETSGEAEFLILSGYDNKVLLYRKESIKIAFSDDLQYENSEYTNSYVDDYLEKIYYIKELNSIKPKIVSSDIEVIINKSKQKVKRHIFVLSSNELCGGTEYYVTPLGIEQNYFRNTKNRTNKNLEYNEYRFLRDFYDSFDTTFPMVLTNDGSIGTLRNIQNNSDYFVNPVFYIDSNTLVEKKDNKFYIK